MKPKIAVLAALLTAALLGWTAPAQAASSNLCPDTGGTQYLVDTALDAADVAAGYNNTACELVISVPVTPTLQDWDVFAKSFRTSAAVINTAGQSGIHITTSGNIVIAATGELRARSEVHLRCTALGCNVLGTSGVLLASESLDVFAIPGDPLSGPATKGNLTIVSVGDTILNNTLVYGGSRVHIIATQGAVTWACPRAGGDVCADPTIACPGGFPCTLNFTSAAQVLQTFCTPSSGPKCGGGSNEIRVTALLDIDITGSIISSLSHMTFESKQGRVLAANTQLTAATDLQVIAFIHINAESARWVSGQTLRAQTKVGCLAGTLCINAKLADFAGFKDVIGSTAGNNGDVDLCGGIFDRGVPGLPRFNGVASFPYPLTVILSALACAPLPPAIIQ
jgi:hypothetical protein